MNDMERKLEQLGAIRKQTKLSSEARLDIRTRLQSHMVEHPATVRVDDDIRHHVVAATNRRITRKTHFKKPMIIGLIVALVLGGGTAFAAEATVPGDVLYPVKIHVNEEVRSAFAISDEAEARLQAELAAERLKEAEELAARHKLDAAARADLETRFTVHANDADTHVEKMKEKHDEENAGVIEADLDATLRAHTKLLNAIDADVETKHEVNVLVNSVHAELNTTHRDSDHSEKSSDASTTANGENDAQVSHDDAGANIHINLHGDASDSADGKEKNDNHEHGAVDTKIHTNVGTGDARVDGGSSVHLGL